MKKYKVCQVIKALQKKFHHPKTNLAKFGYIIYIYIYINHSFGLAQGIIQETFSASK